MASASLWTMPDAVPPTPPATSAVGRPPNVDLVLLGVAVLAVSTSAPLIRGAGAPSLAVAFWRTVLAVPVVGILALVAGPDQLRALRDAITRRRAMVAGVLLAAHFAAWVPSVSLTSVASSTALVATQPVWAALIARWRGERVPQRAWVGIALAMAGAVVLSGVDLSISPEAVLGDLLALAGGMLAAAYVTAGADVRQVLSTGAYTLVCYAVASVALLGVCLVGRQALSGYDGHTWLILLALTLGPQLLGHTVLNRVLGTTSPTLVSVAILFEIVGAALLAWAFFDEVPPLTALPAGVLIAAGIVVVVRADHAPPVATPAVD